MTVKPKMRSAPNPTTILSFPSKGPILDERGNKITNDHSTLMDVGGTQVWLHNEQHGYTGNEVHVKHSHAVDMNLVDPPEGEDVPTIGNAPDSAPVTALGTGQSGHKPDDVKSKTTSPFSNTGPDTSKSSKRL